MAMNKDFGAFELLQKIGAGGMASVYLANQKALGRKVVLKILYPHLAEDEKLVARFEREARAAAMMRHENIIQVIDMGRHEDVVYIAMEYVEGMDLKKWLEAHGTPPIEMAVLMLRDLCRGLEHAHGHHIVHRDIKPANVMLTPDGTIKLMDFGLARSGSDTSTQVTVVGSVMGTPAYMSPEQATGEVVDERSDIFSTGVLAYELLGGSRPFLGDSYSTVLRSILTVEPPDVTQFNPLVPEEIARIVRSMLQKDVGKRPPSVAPLREGLEDVIEQMGLLRGRDLLREYVQDPEGVAQKYRQKRLSRHLDQGLYFENMGLGKIDDALLEFRRVLHIDPKNSVARDHVAKLERERAQVIAKAPPAAEAGDEHTVVMRPEEAAKLQAGVAAKPAPPAPPKPAAPAPPKQPAAAAPPPRAPAPPPKPAPPKPAAPKPPAGAKKGLPVPAMIGAGVLLVAVLVVGWFAFKPKGAPSTEPTGGTEQSAAPAGDSGMSALPADTTSHVATRADTVLSPLPAISAAFDSAEYGEVVRRGRMALSLHTMSRHDQRTTRELIARALVRDKRTAEAGVAFTDLLKAYPSYKPAASFTSDERGVFETARLNLQGVRPETAAVAVAPEPPKGKTGTIHVSVMPFASFAVDGKELDANKRSFTANVPAGHHTVTLTHPTLGRKEWAVDVVAGKTTELSHNFAVSTGTISVSSDPWAEIYMDGSPVGKATPWEIKDVPVGKHEISLVRDGWAVDGGPQTVEVRAGESKSVKFKLKKK